MATVEVTFSALPIHVRTARMVAVAAARRGGFEGGLLDEVRLAVGEACTRAVGIHRRYAPEERVSVLLIDDADRFTVCVRDAGPATPEVTGAQAPAPRGKDLLDTDAFALGSAHAEPADPGPNPSDGGLWLAVIAGLADELSVEHAPDGAAGTLVRMAWPRPPAGDADAATPTA